MLTLVDHEVVDQLPAPIDRLGADAGPTDVEVRRIKAGDQGPGPGREIPPGPRAHRFAQAGPPVARRHPPEPGPAREPQQVRRDDGALVGLESERQRGVGSDQHIPADDRGEMDAEKRVARIGHRIDEAVHQPARVLRQPPVASSKRHDPHRPLLPQQSRDRVGAQSRADDQFRRSDHVAAAQP